MKWFVCFHWQAFWRAMSCKTHWHCLMCVTSFWHINSVKSKASLHNPCHSSSCQSNRWSKTWSVFASCCVLFCQFRDCIITESSLGHMKYCYLKGSILKISKISSCQMGDILHGLKGIPYNHITQNFDKVYIIDWQVIIDSEVTNKNNWHRMVASGRSVSVQ